MNLVFGLTQQQSQQLAMTTEMRQALQVLELGTEDLIEYVSQKAEENLFLQVRKNEVTHRQVSLRAKPSHVVPSRPEVAGPVSLADDLKAQVRLMVHDKEFLQNALRLVDDLDDRGYLDEYSVELGRALELSQDKYDQAVAVIQSCDPLGIGARNLRECLFLQVSLVPKNLQSRVRALVEGHLERLASGQMTAISRDLGCSLDELHEAVHALRSLNPKPGDKWGHEPTVSLRPDLFIEGVRAVDTGLVMYAVSLPDDISGLLQMDSSYQGFRRGTMDSEARQYLNNQWREAQWLRRCIVQRGVTLQRIGEALCTIQSSFLSSGWSHLRPMTLADVALVLGVHESTVSRAIRNKYAATPQGLVELKSLFSSGLKTAHGEVSAEAMKYRIRQLIRSEKPGGVYTDAELAEQFADEGISISRRTVAKYRDAMGIPSAAQRKRMA